jgi:predicted aspartyl protease
VLHAPARRGGIRRASKTKINNLETNEFVSNPPLKKKELAGVKKLKTWNF